MHIVKYRHTAGARLSLSLSFSFFPQVVKQTETRVWTGPAGSRYRSVKTTGLFFVVCCLKQQVTEQRLGGLQPEGETSPGRTTTQQKQTRDRECCHFTSSADDEDGDWRWWETAPMSNVFLFFVSFFAANLYKCHPEELATSHENMFPRLCTFDGKLQSVLSTHLIWYYIVVKNHYKTELLFLFFFSKCSNNSVSGLGHFFFLLFFFLKIMI